MTSNIPLKNPEGVRGGEEEAGGVERQPEARDGCEGEDTKWAEGGRRFEGEGESEVLH